MSISRYHWQARHATLLSVASIGVIALSRLKKGRGDGVVYGVYRRAVNIMMPEGLVSVVPNDGERGPINLTLEEAQEFVALGLKRGDLVRRSGAIMSIAEDRVLISFIGAVPYDPTGLFSEKPRSASAIGRNLEIAKKEALVSGRMGGLGELIELVTANGLAQPKSTMNIYSAAAFPFVLSLSAAIRKGDIERVRFCARNLIGLGPGLTPSSDDMLSGLMITMNSFARNSGGDADVIRRICSAITSEGKELTTPLSQESLAEAAEGRGNEPVMELCRSLFTGRPAEVRMAVRRAEMTGETSGTDIILGVLLGAHLLIHGEVR